ncbi:Hypothetical protein ORPV_15 [Orpheovirus IHUMI-LCC2]|uniref:Uncharacterized protein n=1 Tax=Orpheovirus IHUMI-LCC2 TaxID=2023057 RepID=A0A2I2L366_9VIRU|nr:Hypothetical protein ORPV_15 [Orpheovirus IHUMI-LCC2]SNW61919.1 Hypothetical protein ORPV_15 [Orpheovirus IHUMI-LCC2]
MSYEENIQQSNSTVQIKSYDTDVVITREINQGSSGLSYLEALGTSATETYDDYRSFTNDLQFTYEGLNLSNYSIKDFYEESGNILLDIGIRPEPPLDKKLLIKYILDRLQEEEIEYLKEVEDLGDIDISIRIKEILDNNVIGFIIFSSGRSIMISCPNYESFYNFILGIQDFSIIIRANKSPRTILY